MAEVTEAALLSAIEEAWGFSGIVPHRVIAKNDFGNVLVEDRSGAIWRICPEDLACRPLATDASGLDLLWTDRDFVADWSMAGLVTAARADHGNLPEGSVFHLVIPASLGGKYATDNIRIAPLLSVLRVAGSIQQQISGLPDGAQIRLDVTDD